jgi:hypothetical protein
MNEPRLPPPSEATHLTRDRFVVRFDSSDRTEHQIECHGGTIVDWRRERADTTLPALELELPDDTFEAPAPSFPFADAPELHDALLVRTAPHADFPTRMFPLCIGAQVLPAELVAELDVVWMLHDGPFGPFAWRNRYANGVCTLNDAVTAADVGDLPWDVVLEVDFVDCIDAALGHLEVRDLLARGNVHGTIASLSAFSWFLERDEMRDIAAPHRLHAELLRDWTQIARSDPVVAWATSC